MLDRLRKDLVTSIFLGLVAIGGVIYTAFELTPSSYGIVLAVIDAQEYGPVMGTAKQIRADEWGMTTPFFQAAVRNGFGRINESSLYREDLRSQSIPIGLPLKDWAMLFKPQLWLFYLVSPALAYSAFWAIMICGCLAGYQLLLRQLGLDPLLAVAVAVMITFCGFVQFWWTTFAPVIAGFPWILLIFFSSMRWWHKALLFSYVLPIWVLADIYPTLIVELAFASLVVVLALRPSMLRQPRELAAIAIGGAVMALVVYTYYADVIPIMRNTIYPGHRIAEPGTVALSAVLSQFFPYVSFTLSDYRNFRGMNICEIGSVGSFLPLLTLCLVRYRELWNHHFVRRALILLLAAFALITLWQIAPLPAFIGRLLLWNLGPATRLLLISGFLLTLASLLIWTHKLISVHPVRILIFIVIGPLASLVLKLGLLHAGLEESVPDVLLCGFAIAIGLVACYVPAPIRPVVLFTALALINVYSFGRFNPVQSAGPIFETPDTHVMRQYRESQDASPDHLLLDAPSLGAVLNGLGFRSPAHALMAPVLPVMRNYFPTMNPERFNMVFNRFSEILLTDDRIPNITASMAVNLPREAFEPPRNIRQAVLETLPHPDCATQRGGAVDRMSEQTGGLFIEGWAPWRGENKEQQLHIICARPLRIDKLLTVRRPDIAETLQDYGFSRCGFRLTLSTVDTRPLTAGEIVIVAHNTTQGLAQLNSCGNNR